MDVIRKAVELADGWFYEKHAGQVSGSIRTLEGYRGTEGSIELLDALAAQLVRQVDALDGGYTYHTIVMRRATEIYEGLDWDDAKAVGRAEDNDRTMNTIKAIVESGMLE